MNRQFYQSLRKEIEIAFTAERASNRNLVPDNIVEGGASSSIMLRDGDGNITGQKEPMYAVATRAKGTSSCPIHDNAFIHARIIRTVNQLPDYHHALVTFCYSNKGNDWEMITLVAEYVWSRMEIFIEGWQRFKDKTLKEEKIQKLKSLTFNAMLHFKEGAANHKKLYTIELLAKLMLVSDSNWRRDWGPFWNQLLNILTHLDEQALSLVDRNIRALKAA